jgi:hypothetical protein
MFVVKKCDMGVKNRQSTISCFSVINENEVIKASSTSPLWGGYLIESYKRFMTYVTLAQHCKYNIYIYVYSFLLYITNDLSQ